MPNQLSPRNEIASAVDSVRHRIATTSPADKFAAKIALSSRTPADAEEFNNWHAASDNVTEGGVKAAWGRSAERFSK